MMIKHIKKSMIMAVILSAGTAVGLSSCNTGTSPGETNIERSDIKEEGSMVEAEGNNKAQAERDSLEKYYDQNNKGGAVHAGDGQKQTPKEGVKRKQ